MTTPTRKRTLEVRSPRGLSPFPQIAHAADGTYIRMNCNTYRQMAARNQSLLQIRTSIRISNRGRLNGTPFIEIWPGSRRGLLSARKLNF